MYGSVHVHMVYSVRAKLAVRITARLAGPRPFYPVTGPPAAPHSGRPVLRCPLALDYPAMPAPRLVAGCNPCTASDLMQAL